MNLEGRNPVDGDVAQLVEHAADAGSILRCGKGFLSQIQLPVPTLLRCLHPRVQSHALTSVYRLKILRSMSEFGGLWKH